MINHYIDKLVPQKINIFIPKFKLALNYRLPKALQSLGMTDAFGNNANFSGMNGSKDLRISDVIHKAVLEVNEEGSEAAGASAVAVGIRSAGAKKRAFKANHPFFFIIRENHFGTILFMGRLVAP